MKKAFLLTFFVCFLLHLKAQKPLSREAIKDFAAVCWFNYKFGHPNFVATMNTYLPYKRSEIALLMENLDTDKTGREEVFKLFYRIARNYESLFNYFYRLQIGAVHSRELALYIMNKYDKSYEEVEPTTKSKFFQGTKRFSDGEAWDIVVTINKSLITLKTYPNAKNTYHKDKSKPTEINTGYIKDEIIYIKWKNGYDSTSLKIEDGVLYEANNEGYWNVYKEVIKK